MSRGIAGRLASAFVNSKLTPLLILASLVMGIFAVIRTPREEEPQIIVPMADVLVQFPGATAKEVEQRVTSPLEKLIWEVPGVNMYTRHPRMDVRWLSYAFSSARSKRRHLLDFGKRLPGMLI